MLGRLSWRVEDLLIDAGFTIVVEWSTAGGALSIAELANLAIQIVIGRVVSTSSDALPCYSFNCVFSSGTGGACCIAGSSTCGAESVALSAG